MFQKFMGCYQFINQSHLWSSPVYILIHEKANIKDRNGQGETIETQSQVHVNEDAIKFEMFQKIIVSQAFRILNY